MNMLRNYSEVPLWRGPIYITYGTSITVAERESDFRISTDTSYLALMGKLAMYIYLTLTGELRVVYCDDFGENWLRYNGSTLYKMHMLRAVDVCRLMLGYLGITNLDADQHLLPPCVSGCVRCMYDFSIFRRVRHFTTLHLNSSCIIHFERIT